MPEPPRRIFIVGPMGAGKTTIGQRLANAIDYRFIDSDHEIEARTGARISLIFDIEGEQGFRRREHAMIDELTRIDGIVLATGGGAVLDPSNRAALRERGFVIYLRASLGHLLERTSRDRNRPLLQDGDPGQRLAALLEERGPLYEEVADLIVNTGRRTVHRVVSEITDRLASG